MREWDPESRIVIDVCSIRDRSEITLAPKVIANNPVVATAPKNEVGMSLIDKFMSEKLSTVTSFISPIA